MINSMTGFGRGEYADEGRRITVEIKAVNHRYLDVSVKMPKKLNFFEIPLRGLLKKHIQRGKVDVFITYEDFTKNTVSVRYQKEIAAAYMESIQQIADDFSLENDVKAGDLSRYPEVLVLEEQPADEQELWSSLEKACIQALGQFEAARNAEGLHLKEDLLKKCGRMLTNVTYIEERAPEMIRQYHNRLKEKVGELLADTQIDESRLVMEVTLLADKTCVDEETVRLRSHIQATIDTLETGGAIGRRLDFIAQEMNREANTILSKADDLEISKVAITLKTDIEKIREQIQNIE